MKNQHGKPHCHHTGNGAGCDMNCSQCKKECMHAKQAKKESHNQQRENKGYEKNEHPKKWNS